MSNYILEIGTEELPVNFAYDVLNPLRNIVIKWLEENRVEFKDLEVYTTPRRIACYIKNISTLQESVVKEVRGPAKNIAFDENGGYSKAASGFAKSQGVDPESLVLKELNGKEFVFAIKKEEGKKIEEILPDLAYSVLNNIPVPRAMKWGDSNLTFIRPIHWILSLLDDKLISFGIENIQSGYLSYGHRILYPDAFKVKNASSYIQDLKDHYVIVDQEVRKKLIKQQIAEVAQTVNGKAMFSYADEELLKEVTQLVEYPTAIVGTFDKEFLVIPDVVIMTVMRVHQRYFPILDFNNKLLPCFIIISNGSPDAQDTIRAGNEKVIRARLSDGRFYFKNDVSRSLEQRVEELKGITFFEGIGSIHAKMERLQKITLEILKGCRYDIEPELAERAAMLCKTDLTTQMVKEFTELQGQIGYFYALYNGEKESVAVAIKEHYWPTAEGILPQTPLGIILSIADKIDNLVSCFAMNLIPSGSKDPYALRRQILGIISICENANLNLNLNKYLEFALNLVPLQLKDEKKKQILTTLKDFIKGRLRQNLIDRDFRYDLVDAVLNNTDPLENLLAVQIKVKSLQGWFTAHQNDAVKFTTAINRPIRITRNVEFDKVIREDLFEHDSERFLNDKIKELKGLVDEKVKNMDYLSALEMAVKMVKPIDAFFEDVMVMVDDAAVKNNRLALLDSLKNVFIQIADFSSIVI